MRRLRSARARSWRPWWPAVCVLLTVAGSVLLGASPASAHTSLVSSTPGAGEVVVDPARVVALAFSESVSPRQARVVVTGPAGGADLADGPVRVSGATVSRSVGAWPEAGEHRLAYRVLAQDGHPITGEVLFRVEPSTALAAPTATPTPTGPPTVAGAGQARASAPEPAGTGVAPALIAVLGSAAVVLGVGAVRAGRRAQAER